MDPTRSSTGWSGPGTRLAGSIVFHVSACGEALNEVGDLAFQAQFDDGRTVIVRADLEA